MEAGVLHFLFFLAVSLAYAAAVVRHQPPGLSRAIYSIPLFVFFSLSPTQFQAPQKVIVPGTLGFLLGWLANFKLVAFSANRGPLALPALNTLQWLMLLLLPFYTAKHKQPPAQLSSILASLVAKVLVFAVLTVLLASPIEAMHLPWVRHVFYGVYIWLITSINLDAAMPLGVRLLGGLPLQPAMDQPYLATSVRDFWGMRYNQIVSCVLADTVYWPIVEGRWLAVAPAPGPGGKRVLPAGELTNGATYSSQQAEQEVAPLADCTSEQGSLRQRPAVTNGVQPQAPLGAEGPQQAQQQQAALANGGGEAPHAHSSQGLAAGHAVVRRRSSRTRLAVALAAAFAVSGVMHEVAIGYMCGGRVEGTYRMLAFFLVQPPIILAQDALVAALLPAGRRGLAVRALQALGTWALILYTAEHLFWPPFKACRLDQYGLLEFVDHAKALQAALGPRALT